MAASRRAASALVDSVGQATLLSQCANELGVTIDGRLARAAQQTLDMSAAEDSLHGSRGGLAGFLEELRRIIRGRWRRSRRRGHAGWLSGSWDRYVL